MKPKQIQTRKLNLNKQTIQKLDSKKLASVYAGVAAKEVQNTWTIAASILVPVETAICVVTVAL